MAIDVCLPVAKYSHADGLRSDNTVPWTHIAGVDIFVVLKGVDGATANSQLSLRIIQGTRTQENIDIAAYIDAAMSTRRRLERMGRTVVIDQLPIFAITKGSTVAIRYYPNDGLSRRIQIRLQSPEACQQIIECFLRRGMEFQEQRPRTAARPGTANLRPMTDSSQDRPLTMQTPSPYFFTGLSPSKPSPFLQHEVLEAGSLSNHYAATQRAQTRGGIEIGLAAREMPPPTFFNRDTVALPRDVAPERPSTSQLYRSYTTPSQQSRSQYDIPDIAYPTSTTPVERRSSTSQITDLEAIRAVAEQDANPIVHDIPTFALPPLQDPKSTSGWSSTAPLPSVLLSSDPVEPRPQSARPSTAATTAYPETLEHEMPPRRELPAYISGSRSNVKGSDNSSSRPQSALELPPLPKPNAKKAGSATARPGSSTSPIKKLGRLRPSTATSTKGSLAQSEKETERPGTVAGLINQPTAPKKSHERQVSPQSAKPKSMKELLYGQKALAERSPNSNNRVPRLNSLADAPHEVVSPPVTAASSPTKSSDRAAQGPLPMKHADSASLAGYSEQSPPDRQAMMEEFFAANWENEDFIALCDDVENSWRRIALGL